jgi:CheY-like chemotaxis protein
LDLQQVSPKSSSFHVRDCPSLLMNVPSTPLPGGKRNRSAGPSEKLVVDGYIKKTDDKLTPPARKSGSITAVPSCLPLALSSSPSSSKRLSSPSPPSPSMYEHIRVLIAEDNRVNQKVLVRTLEKIGMKNIDVVQNGLEAVNITAQKDYDIIFMDWMMPVMDGLQATKLIVARRERQLDQNHPRIVFLTAHALDDYREQAANAGGDGFISKPFKIAGIQKLLETFQMGTGTAESSHTVKTPRTKASPATANR